MIKDKKSFFLQDGAFDRIGIVFEKKFDLVGIYFAYFSFLGKRRV